MTDWYDEQYRPVSNTETQTNDGFSVRALRDMAFSASNMWGRSSALYLASDAWPGTHCNTSNTSERVILQFAARWVGSGYPYITFRAGGYMSAAATECDWTLYVCQWMYRGPTAITAGWKKTLGEYSTATVTIDSDTWELPPADTTLFKPNRNGEIYMIITGTVTGVATAYLNSICIATTIDSSA